eukprot:g7881.t1
MMLRKNEKMETKSFEAEPGHGRVRGGRAGAYRRDVKRNVKASGAQHSAKASGAQRGLRHMAQHRAESKEVEVARFDFSRVRIVDYYIVAVDFFKHFSPLIGAPLKNFAWDSNKGSLVDWFKSHNLDLEANELKIADIRTIISENDLYSQFKSDFDELCTALENATAPEDNKPAMELAMERLRRLDDRER